MSDEPKIVYVTTGADRPRERRDMAKLSSAERLARAVLLFFDPGPWDANKRLLWMAMTGTEDATSRVLADLARQVRDEEERKPHE